MTRWRQYMTEWSTWAWSVWCARSGQYSAYEWWIYFTSHPEVSYFTADDWAEWWVDPQNWE